MNNNKASLLRYPGGKQRLLNWLIDYLPAREIVGGKYIEPFIGGGAVFLRIIPNKAILSDINPELINLYKGIKINPQKIWDIYKRFPNDKDGYYSVRDITSQKGDIEFSAARTLYLNRTCFKGMWRHNSKGVFNVGYGGQSRRWKITLKDLIDVSNSLKKATIRCSDFDAIISSAKEGDFIFIDPPYSPGQINTVHDHYMYGTFNYKDQGRLAISLKAATKRGVQWCMTNSDHKEIIKLYKGNNIQPISSKRFRYEGQSLIQNY